MCGVVRGRAVAMIASKAEKRTVKQQFVVPAENLLAATHVRANGKDKTTGVEGWGSGKHDHDVSILITGVGGLG